MKEGFTGERSIVLPMMTREMEANDPLVASLYITDIGYYPHADSHFRQRREPIGEHVLIYCMEGAGWFILDDMKYDVRANQYFILPPNKPHAYAAEREHPWTIYWIHFTGPHAAIYSEGADTPQDILPAVNSRISERNHIFEEIFSTLSRSTDIESLRYASSLLHYYLASMHYLRHYRHNEGNTVLSDVVAAAIHYMHENMEHRITLDQIASFTGYFPSRFSSIFRQQTGKSPLAYYNEMKINRARQLLDTTSMHVNQICHKVGIDDSYYFSRLFSKLVGMSPKQYRARRDNGRCLSPQYGS
ncbi:MAG: AraC family transcriptional regulator [Prevotella sp.]|nr:AraC family transcriptional regulator [Prevotella sp.]